MLKVFITNLHAYNEGKLIGKWLDFEALDKETIEREINKIIEAGGGEEVFITDYETDLQNLEIDEYEDIDDLVELGEALSSMSQEDKDKLEFLIEHMGYEPTEALEYIDDVTYYEGYSLEDLAREFVDEGLLGEIPEKILPYINYEALGNDLRHDGYIETDKGVFYLE